MQLECFIKRSSDGRACILRAQGLSRSQAKPRLVSKTSDNFPRDCHPSFGKTIEREVVNVCIK